MLNRYNQTDVSQMNLSYYCRGCKQTVRGIPITEPQYHISSHSDEPWIICRCPTHLCELSFIIYDNLNNRVRRIYPLPSFDPNNYHKSIPKAVREDIAEADRCFHASAYKASLSMNRRAIQRIVLDKIEDESIQKKKLWAQINELHSKGFITTHLKDTAHEIRHFGNFGAHPSNDELDKTTKEDAEIVDRLTFDLIRAIYITPYETKQLQKKRESK